MKKIAFILVSILISIQLLAHAPRKMSFQAVIRSANNLLVSLKPVNMRISVIQGSSSGESVYVETQTGTTNTNGLVSMQIGTGLQVKGSFESINWDDSPYFIEVETDPDGGIDYSLVSITELLSVPYALFAASDESEVTGLTGAPGTNGTDGINGAQGIQGSQGTAGYSPIKNIDYFDGSAGANGIQGIQGAQGTAGYSPVKNIDYFDGDSGSIGEKGNTGTNGKTILSGTDPPIDTIGIVGDFFINTTGYFIYGPKTNGSWGIGISITGETGGQGIQGDAGTKGETGLKGDVGTSGTIGATGGQGIQGDAGTKGDTGLKGDTGTSGTIGATGGQGIQGDAGT
ncbi:MAG: collagen-like protein, partial [Bacteroidia bacterium]